MQIQCHQGWQKTLQGSQGCEVDRTLQATNLTYPSELEENFSWACQKCLCCDKSIHIWEDPEKVASTCVVCISRELLCKWSGC